MNKHKRFWRSVVLGLALPLVTLVGLAGAQNVTQGYLSDVALQNGMIVRLKPGSNESKVEPVTMDSQKDMFGIVVSNSDAPVSISDPDQTQVFVATYGKYAVLVNTQNGTIKSGDLITISSIKGMGMKATRNEEYILGKALSGFADNSNAIGHATLDDNLKTEVALGRIMIDISVAKNPTYAGDTVDGVPSFLQKAANAVSDKPITALRLYACLAVMFICVVVAGMIIFSGVRTGMTAVGRNPLARKSILRNMITMTMMAMVIVIIGLVAVYLLLKI
jgi:hypothetical protein